MLDEVTILCVRTPHTALNIDEISREEVLVLETKEHHPPAPSPPHRCARMLNCMHALAQTYESRAKLPPIGRSTKYLGSIMWLSGSQLSLTTQHQKSRNAGGDVTSAAGHARYASTEPPAKVLQNAGNIIGSNPMGR